MLDVFQTKSPSTLQQTPSALHWRQTNIERGFLPQRKYTLVLHPVIVRVNEIDIEMEKKPCKNDPHFRVS